MKMDLGQFEGATLISLSGRLGTTGVQEVGAAFAEAVDSGGRSTIVDLAGVEFISSLGIRMFISAARLLAGRGQKLALCNASPSVIDVIEMTSLLEIIPLADSVAEALESVAT